MLGSIIHYYVLSEVIACECQDTFLGIPDRNRERSVQTHPHIVTKFFPRPEDYLSVRQRKRVLRPYVQPRDQFFAIVQSQIGCDHCTARSTRRLPIEAILGCHAHKHMDETNV